MGNICYIDIGKVIYLYDITFKPEDYGQEFNWNKCRNRLEDNVQ